MSARRPATGRLAEIANRNGKGGFGPPVRIKDQIDGGSVFSLAAGDFDNNGAPDLAIPIEDKGKVAIMLNTK